MEKIINKLKEECVRLPNCSDYYTGWHNGLCQAMSILKTSGGLWLEEITEEEARKENEVVGRWDSIGISEMFVPNYQVVTYDPDAEGWGVEWIDCIGQSQAVMYATPSKFYRIPK